LWRPLPSLQTLPVGLSQVSAVTQLLARAWDAGRVADWDWCVALDSVILSLGC
jgi:hypothetical protein